MGSPSPIWEELVFEFRNKEYGAFLLRYCYPWHVTVSALGVILLFAAGMLGYQYSNGQKPQVQEIRTVRVIDYNELSPPPSIEKIIIPPKKVVAQQAPVKKYVAPVVTREEVAEPEELITMVDVKLLMATESNADESTEGVETVVAAPPEVLPPGSSAPEFPGGTEAMMAWLHDHMEYPSVAKRMGIEGKVVVEFMVDETGKTGHAEIIESLHRLCDDETIRLILAMPAWTPGVRNGVKTRQKCTLSVPFVLS